MHLFCYTGKMLLGPMAFVFFAVPQVATGNNWHVAVLRIWHPVFIMYPNSQIGQLRSGGPLNWTENVSNGEDVCYI